MTDVGGSSEVMPSVVLSALGDLQVVEMTGELVSIQEASDEALARWFATYKDARDLMNSAKREVDAEFIRRADYNATQHIDVEGVGRITVDGPGDEEVWNTNDLRAALRKLVSEGEISEQAAYQALEKVVSWKVKYAGINNLRKLGGYVRDTVDACCDRQEKVRRTRLSAFRRSS